MNVEKTGTGKVIDARAQFKQRRIKAAEHWDISHIYQHIKDQAARKLRASVLEKQSKDRANTGK